MIEVSNLVKRYGDHTAVDHLSFQIEKGKIYGFLGPNGAGKSTLIKVLTGVHEFESGSIRMADKEKNIINHSPQEAQENGISTVYQEVNLCPNLTVAENLFIGREPRKMGMINWKEMNNRSEKLLESLDIHVPPTQMLDECSVAIQQMIAIARAVDMKCQVLILDEPTIAQDWKGRQIIGSIIRSLSGRGKLVIAILHDMDFVAENFERVIIMAHGQVLADGTAKEVFAQEEVLKKARLQKPYVMQLSEALGYEKSYLTVEELLKDRMSLCAAIKL